MKSKFFGVLLGLVVVSQLTTAANAFVGMSSVNAFYKANMSQTVELGRRFIINSDSDYLIPEEKPESGQKPDNGDSLEPRYKNGDAIYIERIYKNKDVYWGIAQCNEQMKLPYGWFPINQLLMLYAPIDFDEEYKNEYYTYEDNINLELASNKLVVWKWPGSDSEKIVFEAYSDDLNYGGFKLENLDVDHAYKDDSGREWGYASIEFTTNHIRTQQNWDGNPVRMDSWICLSDLANKSDIPSFNPAPPAREWTPPSNLDVPKSNSKTTIPPLVFVIVAILAIGTIIFFTVRGNHIKKIRTNQKPTQKPTRAA